MKQPPKWLSWRLTILVFLFFGVFASGASFGQIPEIVPPIDGSRFRSRNILQTGRNHGNQSPERVAAETPSRSNNSDDPRRWGAPGNPDTKENVDFSKAEEEFPPPAAAPEPTLAELFEKAKPTDPIPLKQKGKFITSDRVQLTAIYYKGNADKSTIPVILLHGKGKTKETMIPIAKKLAEAGMAVLVPDLRGHGESVISWVFEETEGERPQLRQKDDYKVDSFSELDYDAMRQYDGLLWFQFLTQCHNYGILNLRRLVIVGSEFGGSVGSAWLLNDWQVSSPKKGRFTKGLILLSPDNDPVWKLLGGLKVKQGTIGYLIIAGGLTKSKMESAEKVRDEIGHEKEETPTEMKKIEFHFFQTEKQGIDLLTVDSFKVPDLICEFIQKQNEAPKPLGGQWAPIKLD